MRTVAFVTSLVNKVTLVCSMITIALIIQVVVQDSLVCLLLNVPKFVKMPRSALNVMIHLMFGNMLILKQTNTNVSANPVKVVTSVKIPAVTFTFGAVLLIKQRMKNP